MTPIYIILAFGGGLTVALFAGRLMGWGANSTADKDAEAEAQSILQAAHLEAEERKKTAEVEGKELARKIKREAEESNRERMEALEKRKTEIVLKEKEVDRKKKDSKRLERDLEKRERSISGRENNAESMAKKAEASLQESMAKLESVANMSAKQAQEELQNLMIEDARKAAAQEVESIQLKVEEEAGRKSKEILATAVQRYASDFVAERTVSVVPLPSDDMKGRLIGREGRNIRALEAAAGIDLIIDDTSEVITVSCFNPVRREIARMSVEKLVADGRIHPTRIEEVVAASEKEIDGVCKEAGEQAVFDLGLHKIHPELIRTIGRLKFRDTYASNLLDHSIEVGFLSGLLAAELGVSVKAARRAGLLHDIGKAADHQLEGDHAEVGANLARKHGEAPRICDAIRAHHDEPTPTTVLANIVDAANRLSAARPGARREVLSSYIKRLDDLEKMASSFAGVHKVFAVQAGREVRVMVQNNKVSDAEARILSGDIAKKIESQATYAGQVRVVVTRETRASDYAQ